VFLGINKLKDRIVLREPPGPQLSESPPTPGILLKSWPQSTVQWEEKPNIAHFNPLSRRISLSISWRQDTSWVSAHTIAHERCHAKQPGYWTWWASWAMVISLIWGLISGIMATMWPPAIEWGALAQWMWDFSIRQRLEWRADECAAALLINHLTIPANRNTLSQWIRVISHRRRIIWALEGVGRSGLTVVIATLIVYAMTHLLVLGTR
jgi:hypothetical protein